MPTPHSIGFIGAGNMATCIIQGLCQQGYPASHLFASNRNADKLQSLAALGIHTTTDNTAILDCDIVVLAVKPQHMKALLSELPQSSKCQLMVSVAAGITCEQIQTWYPQVPYLCRAMPNTPAQLGIGVTALCGSNLPDEWQTHIDQLFQSIGETVWLTQETQMDTATALSGSGPAYSFYILEAMIAGGVALGLSETAAETLAKQTLYGAAVMALSQPASLSELRHQVTSKGGTTEAGLAQLAALDLPAVIAKALQAAAERGKTLSKQYA